MSTLNNDKNVYILGAGFSKEIGLPLQNNFLSVAKEIYHGNPSKYEHFKNIFKYQENHAKMRSFLSYPLFNLENLFNLLEMESYYSGRKKVEGIKKDFLRLIKDVLVELTPPPTWDQGEGSKYNNYLRFMELFSKNIVDFHADTIISFNYDLVIEAAICLYNNTGNIMYPMRKLRLDTKLGNQDIKIENPSKYFNVSIDESLFDAEKSQSAIKLIKLHGSINWQKGSDTESFIIPPTWNKSDKSISKLWKLAYEELKEAKRIIIIGYSFPETDIYVKSLLALALNENEISPVIYFINPDVKEVKERCLSLLDKHFEKYCEYKEAKFSEFIKDNVFIRDKLKR